jgi:hypothetical protein
MSFFSTFNSEATYISRATFPRKGSTLPLLLVQLPEQAFAVLLQASDIVPTEQLIEHEVPEIEVHVSAFAVQGLTTNTRQVRIPSINLLTLLVTDIV